MISISLSINALARAFVTEVSCICVASFCSEAFPCSPCEILSFHMRLCSCVLARACVRGGVGQRVEAVEVESAAAEEEGELVVEGEQDEDWND